jgi:hypothetical protein
MAKAGGEKQKIIIFQIFVGRSTTLVKLFLKCAVQFYQFSIPLATTS